MAYFPNGESGRRYIEGYCVRCENWRDLGDGGGFGCPVMDLHLTWGYNEEPLKRDALNWFIPMDAEGVYPRECRMLLAKCPPDVPGQMKLELAT